MKATGIVRRIDDLGRIVIPKEIRKNLKLHEGDSLEIFVEDMNIILRKYSLIDNFDYDIKRIVDVYYKCFKKNIIITDKEKIIASSKNIKLSGILSSNIKDKIIDRVDKIISDEKITVGDDKFSNFYFSSIIVDSDAIGSIVLISDDISDYDIGVIKLIKEILVKNIEE